MSIFSKYHIDFIKALHRHHVNFIIIGGQAAIYHGVRRGTGDLDILIEPTRNNGEKLLKAFHHLDLQVDDLKPEEFENELFLGLGFEPDAVDLMTYTPGINFNESYQRATIIYDEGVPIRIISLEDLIYNKQSMNRTGEKKMIDDYDAIRLNNILRLRKGN